MIFEDKLPLSGKAVRLRGMTGHEEDMLTDKQLVKKGKVMDNILTACIEAIEGTKPTISDVSKLTTADRTYLLVKIRELSYGATIENAEIVCTNKNCRDKQIVDINLTDLPVRVSETSNEDEETEFTLPVTNTKVKFRQLRGTDEQKLAKFGEAEILTVGIQLRLTEVEGTHINDYKKWLKGLPVRDRSALRKAMEATELGIDTVIKVECDECGTEIKVRAESLQDFFFPEM